MDNSPLRKLPPEIRLHVYEFALTEENPVTVTIENTRNKKGERVSRLAYAPHYALEETCKEIRRECSVIFFKENTFLIRFKDIPGDGYPEYLHTTEEGFVKRYAEFASGDWYAKFTPLARFHNAIEKMNLSNVRVQIDLSTFTKLYTLLFWLNYLLFLPILDWQSTRFSGECSVKLSVVTAKPDGGTEETAFTIDCLDPIQSLRATSQLSRERMQHSGVGYLQATWVSMTFKGLADEIENRMAAAKVPSVE